MAYAIMIELKEPWVCEIPCNHNDCDYHRNFVNNAICKTCNKQIEPNQGYYGNRLGNLEHEKCHHFEDDD